MLMTSQTISPEASTEAITHKTPVVSSSWELRQIAMHLGSQFQVVRELGKGAMGVVFLARDIALHRLVAIKVLRHEMTGSPDHHERFRREARMTARLSHPNIVPVHTFGEIGDFVYIIMKYVHGESLAVRLRREGTVGGADARRILVELAQALDYAHREGVVHRDLKAENILIERGSGRAMLTDFGVALLRSLDPDRDTGARYGTPHYMSPEQAAGEQDLDGRSDLYSLGVLGYYMLSGELPFHATTFEALAAKHIAEAHVPVRSVAKVDDDVADAIEGCLMKERDGRWRNGRELAESMANPKRRRGLAGAVFRLGASAAGLAALLIR
jgi:eukaryotic-like serine/threonine-protein kinase